MQEDMLTMIDKKTLYDMIQTFYFCAEIPIAIFDRTGSKVADCGIDEIFCRNIDLFEFDCEQICSNNAIEVCKSGNKKYFECEAGLKYAAFPIGNLDYFCAVMGPYVNCADDRNIFLQHLNMFNINSTQLLEMYEKFAKLKAFNNERIEKLKKILYYMFNRVFIDIENNEQEPREDLYDLWEQNISGDCKDDNDTNIVKEPDSSDDDKNFIDAVYNQKKEEIKDIVENIFTKLGIRKESSIWECRQKLTDYEKFIYRVAIKSGASQTLVNRFVDNVKNVNERAENIFQIENGQKREAVTFIKDFTAEINSSATNRIIKNSVRHIASNYAYDINLERMAQRVNLNPSYFSTAFKSVTGVTFKEFINIIRVEESKKLLVETDYSIDKIAQSTGFDNQSYFSKVFKKYTDTTPRHYKLRTKKYY